MGKPELPGIRKRNYYISKDQIAEWLSQGNSASCRSLIARITMT